MGGGGNNGRMELYCPEHARARSEKISAVVPVNGFLELRKVVVASEDAALLQFGPPIHQVAIHRCVVMSRVDEDIIKVFIREVMHTHCGVVAAYHYVRPRLQRLQVGQHVGILGLVVGVVVVKVVINHGPCVD